MKSGLKWTDLPIGTVYKAQYSDGRLHTWTVIGLRPDGKARLHYEMDDRSGETWGAGTVELGPSRGGTAKDRWLVYPEPTIEEDPV